jgi:hypothetical protein
MSEPYNGGARTDAWTITGDSMKFVVVAATLIAGLFWVSSSPASADERWGSLTRDQTRAYHACLFESWIQDYCHSYSLAYSQCVIANGGGKYPLEGRRFTEDYCWYTAQGLAPR